MLYSTIENQIKDLELNSIPEERKESLNQLTEYIQSKKDTNQVVNLNFICTHNSRRSHLSQVWAQSLAYFFKISNVLCYSGGTEATALFTAAAAALAESGFNIGKLCESDNPVYSIKYSENAHPIIGFSKVYDADFNPKTSFAAIMTCSSADKGCPFIPGTERRISLNFEDPKAFDHTPEQKAKYLERSLQIATELKFAFSNVK